MPARRKEPRYVAEDRGYRTPCHIWQLRVHKTSGYGVEKVAGRDRYAHVVAWERANGPVPDGLELDHLCRVRACVRPDHCEPVTRTENIRRGAHAKLSFERIAEARELREQGWTQQAIADHFGVAQGTISMALSGVTWKERT